MTTTITTDAELDEFLESMESIYILASDADGQPWLLYQTEDDAYAASFPVEGVDGYHPVVVADVIVRADSLSLPLTVLYHPDVPAEPQRVPPGVVAVIAAIADVSPPDFQAHLLRLRADFKEQITRAILALFAAQPTVKPSQEALREAIFHVSYEDLRWVDLDEETQAEFTRASDAILALLPGRTEAEVCEDALAQVRGDLRAEALVRSYADVPTFTATEVFDLAARFTSEWVDQAGQESSNG